MTPQEEPQYADQHLRAREVLKNGGQNNERASLHMKGGGQKSPASSQIKKGLLQEEHLWELRADLARSRVSIQFAGCEAPLGLVFRKDPSSPKGRPV